MQDSINLTGAMVHQVKDSLRYSYNIFHKFSPILILVGLSQSTFSLIYIHITLFNPIYTNLITICVAISENKLICLKDYPVHFTPRSYKAHDIYDKCFEMMV
jgi:hypothetical protein